MPDFSKSKVYKIVCNVTGLVYIGSTTQTLSQRLQDHIRNYRRYLNGKTHYVLSFKIIENNNYEIILNEDCSCERKEQLHARERYWIENTECVNMVIPTRTTKEWRDDNKEKMDKYFKEYRECNKEKNKEVCKEYRKNNLEYRKECDKEYYLKNKEKIQKQRKEHLQNNKEKINKHRRELYQINKEGIS